MPLIKLPPSIIKALLEGGGSVNCLNDLEGYFSVFFASQLSPGVQEEYFSPTY